MRSKHYDNVALVLLSKDEDGNVWVHFGVEKRHGEHLLSTFGGQIDAKPGDPTCFEKVVDAALREFTEESLGVYNYLLPADFRSQLIDPNKTYSYVHPGFLNEPQNEKAKGSLTLVLCTFINHPDSLKDLADKFNNERNQRIRKEAGKQLTKDAELEVKGLRFVRFDELKGVLKAQAKKFSFLDDISYLNVDRKSKKFSGDGKLIDYSVFKKGDEPVLGQVPKELNLRKEVFESLRRITQGIETRLMGVSPVISHPTGTQEPGALFYGKSLRVDDVSFIYSFLNSLPVKGLDYPVERSHLRHSNRRRYSRNWTETIDRKQKKKYGFGKKHTDATKAGFSKHQSISLYHSDIGSPVFGWMMRLNVGIIGVDVLPNRLVGRDGGTQRRPYETDDRVLGLQYYEALEKKKGVTPLLDFHQAAITLSKDFGDSTHNEILGRIRFNPKTTTFCTFEDSIQSTWAAIAFGQLFEEIIRQRAQELYDKKQLSESEYRKFQEIKIGISYYYPASKKASLFTEKELNSFKAKAKELYDSREKREEALGKGEYEFLLLIDDVDDIISDGNRFEKIARSRLYIAEALVDKYFKKHRKPATFNNISNWQLPAITRSFIEKIINGKIAGFQMTEQGRIKLHNKVIMQIDLTGLDTSSIDFSYSSLNFVTLNSSKIYGKNMKYFHCYCDDPRKQSQNVDDIINDEDSFMQIAQIDLVLAESLIDEYIKKHNKGVDFKTISEWNLVGITRTFIEKILEGKIVGFKRSDDGRIQFKNKNIANIDLSGVDMSKLDLSDSRLENVSLSRSKISGKNISFNNCNFDYFEEQDQVAWRTCTVTDSDKRLSTKVLRYLLKNSCKLSEITLDEEKISELKPELIQFIRDERQEALKQMFSKVLDNKAGALLSLLYHSGQTQLTDELFPPIECDLLLTAFKDEKFSTDAFSSTVTLVRKAYFDAYKKTLYMEVNEFVRKVLPKIQDVNLQDKESGNTTLHHLAMSLDNLSDEEKQVIVQKDFLLDAQNKEGKTPLYYGVRSADVVSYLLEKGANPNIPDENGNLPLHFAFRQFRLNPEVIQHLIQKTDNILHKNKRGFSPLEELIEDHLYVADNDEENEIKDIIKLFYESAKDPQQKELVLIKAITQAIKMSKTNIIEFVLNLGKIDLNDPRFYDGNPLIGYESALEIAASYSAGPGMFLYLLKKGAKLKEPTQGKNSALISYIYNNGRSIDYNSNLFGKIFKRCKDVFDINKSFDRTNLLELSFRRGAIACFKSLLVQPELDPKLVTEDMKTFLKSNFETTQEQLIAQEAKRKDKKRLTKLKC